VQQVEVLEGGSLHGMLHAAGVSVAGLGKEGVLASLVRQPCRGQVEGARNLTGVA
jgi:hypothetical protein